MEHGRRELVNTERRTILCPRCEQEQPMRDFATLGMSPLYADVLTPIYRCKQCNHLFAPRPVMVPIMTATLAVGNGNGNGASH